ncbi:MAG: hypothetical protein KF727_00715 [Microbacteriaceae bacterium]|nr:hypothetical protein [Microbacteriaceae bacterium]
MIRCARPAAAAGRVSLRSAVCGVAAAALLVGALSGCVRNIPVDGASWLAGRDGVIDAEVLVDGTGAWSSSGLIRGELEPGIDDTRLAALVAEIHDYQSSGQSGAGALAVRLGWDRTDFAVDSDDPGDAVAIATWREVAAIDGVHSGVVYADEVRARTLRDGAPAVFDALARLDTGIRLEAFVDEQDLEADRISDDQATGNGGTTNPLALEYLRAVGCVPEDAVRAFVDSLLTREDMSGGTADLCAGVTIDVPAEAPLSIVAQALRDDLDSRGLTGFPVQAMSDDGYGTVRFAALTPGDAARLDVLEVFERPDAPPVSYSLGTEGDLAVTEYGVPTADLLALVLSSPAAVGLAGIGLEGDPVAIVGPPDALPGLLDEALALDAASDSFGSVQLGPDFGLVALQSPDPTGTPDVEAAVRDLRASGATEGRVFSVRYAAFQADIVDGVAALSDPGYVGADVVAAFVEAWND